MPLDVVPRSLLLRPAGCLPAFLSGVLGGMASATVPGLPFVPLLYVLVRRLSDRQSAATTPPLQSALMQE